MEYAKVGNNLQVTETIVSVNSYDYAFLVRQKAHIEASIAQAQIELAKVVTLIAESDKLRLKPALEVEEILGK